jgi:hypothetical protein
MKKINLEKMESARTMLKKGETFAEIRKAIKKEYNESIAPNTLVKLNKELKKEHKPIENELTLEIKNSIKTMIELFKKSVEIEAFVKTVTNNDIQSVKLLEGML